jgi:hypothetical protein
MTIVSYVVGSLIIIVMWSVNTRWFVQRFDPNKNGDENDKISMAELNRNYTLQICALSSCVFTAVISVFLMNRMDNKLGINDGYIIREGFDVSTSLYTLWLVLEYTIFLTSCYMVGKSPHSLHLYTKRFRKMFKPSSA